jgi:glycosyltransferase involved in cell wall biosynthesis/SAM-dependent methyltransferase
MGVLEHIPEDLSVFYDDDYYGLCADGCAGRTYGYENYSFTAEHGTSWAAALIKLLCPSGSVLDIGCANGHLLKKLGPNYEIFGIEANESMCRFAEAEGVKLLGRDLLDQQLRAAHAGRFDAISSIAVFEHLRDIRDGFESALHMLRDGGVLLFEVPLISNRHDNAAWFTSSLEHVWYPSERALRQLVESELGYYLIGAEIHIRGYGSTYVGIVVRDEVRAAEIRSISARVLTRDEDAVLLDERIARMQVGMIHAAVTTHADIDALVAMPVDAICSTMLRRIGDLWQADLCRLSKVEQEKQSLSGSFAHVQAQLQCLKSRITALTNDAAINEIELTREIVSLKEQLRATKAGVPVGAGVQGKSIAASTDQITDEALRGVRPISAEIINAIPDTLVPGAELKVADVTGHQPSPYEFYEGSWPDDQPLLSIVITSFNYGEFIEDAVKSVLDQTFRNLEIIVVEGGSSEGASRLEVAALDRTRIRVLMQGAQHYVGANRNLGISQARGKYICCLDADDKLAPTYLEKAIFLLERHSFDVVSGALKMFGEQNEFIPILERPDLEALLKNNHVLTCAVFRRRLWNQAGGFRDTDRAVTGYVYEDWVFWVRLAALGARFINLAFDPVLRYRVHGMSLSRCSDVVLMERQRKLVRMINADLITPENLERSRSTGAIRFGTPLKALPKISLHPSAEPAGVEHHPTVLLAMPFLILGGAERLLSSVVGHLTANGWRVIVVTSIDAAAEHGDATAWFEQHILEIFHLPRFLSREFWEDFLHHLVRSREVDILWVVGSAFAYDNLRSLRTEFPRLRVADLLFNTLGHTENNRRRRHQIDQIFVENEEVRGWLLDHGETDERIQLIESGVDIDRLHPGLRSEAFRATITEGSDAIIIGFSGRWSEEKEPLTFVEIARRANRAWPVRFVMTGAGHLEPEIKHAIKAAGFPPGRFQLLGNVPDVAVVLASIDVLVVPSRLDGRPLVVQESLAVGTPVLASRVGGLPALVEHGETGWLCDPGDVEGFLQCISEATASREELARKRAAARVSAEARLDVHRMCAAYEQALSGILPQTPPDSDAQLRRTG